MHGYMYSTLFKSLIQIKLQSLSWFLAFNHLYADVTLNHTTEEGAVRLVGGTTPLEGRVEVFLLGHWGTVCHYSWDLADATVVCRQLGYPRAVEAPESAAFGSGSGPSWYYSVYCTGTEQNLNQCSRNTYHLGSACSHTNDAGVVCSSESPYICHLHMIELWLCCVFLHTYVYYVWNFRFFAMVMGIYLNFRGLS